MKYLLIILLALVGCSNSQDRKYYEQSKYEEKLAKNIKTLDQPESNGSAFLAPKHFIDSLSKEVGVRQKVWHQVLDGKYYLDTWVCTSSFQKHNHSSSPAEDHMKIPLEIKKVFKEGWEKEMDEHREPYPYDVVVSGTFDEIKSLKAKEHKKAEAWYKHHNDLSEWAGKTLLKIEDSVKILNDL